MYLELFKIYTHCDVFKLRASLPCSYGLSRKQQIKEHEVCPTELIVFVSRVELRH